MQTVEAIDSNWTQSTVTPQMQRNLQGHTTLMADKCLFLAKIYTTLDHDHWIALQNEIYVCVNATMLYIVELWEQNPHDKRKLGNAILHFRVRSFLFIEARSLWDNLKPEVDFSFLGGRSSLLPTKIK
jgi:hypothetical protein